MAALENPVEKGGSTERRMPDPFDYAAEDELVRIMRQSVEEIGEIELTGQKAYIHAYAHPKKVGEVTDHHGR